MMGGRAAVCGAAYKARRTPPSQGCVAPHAGAGEAFLSALASHLPELRWDAAAGEHVVGYRQASRRHEVWYPTPAMLAARAALAQRHGVGLSIWELGQGLDCFFDLL
jgi:chitinase domain-containing protein 1